VTRAAERLGATLEFTHATSRPTAAKQLRDRVAHGPVLAWLDRGALPWATGVADAMGASPHVVVISELDDDTARVHDTGPRPFSLALPDLATARARLPREKHRLATVRDASPIDLAASVRDAIAACRAELAGKTRHKQFAGNFGIAGFQKWAALLEAPRDRAGWPQIFARGIAVWMAQAWGHYWIERAGTGGGAFRPLYASFLDEAVAITGRTALARAAAAYRELGAAWTDLATAMLPGSIPILAQTRAALDDQAAAYAAGDLGAIAVARDRIAPLRERAAAGELDPHAADLRADLARRLAAIVTREIEAAALLAAGA
jgi:hypothetical protein